MPYRMAGRRAMPCSSAATTAGEIVLIPIPAMRRGSTPGARQQVAGQRAKIAPPDLLRVVLHVSRPRQGELVLHAGRRRSPGRSPGPARPWRSRCRCRFPEGSRRSRAALEQELAVLQHGGAVHLDLALRAQVLDDVPVDRRGVAARRTGGRSGRRRCARSRRSSRRSGCPCRSGPPPGWCPWRTRPRFRSRRRWPAPPAGSPGWWRRRPPARRPAFQRRRMSRIRRPLSTPGNSKQISPSRLSSTGAVMISPSGMLLLPSQANHLRPWTEKLRSVSLPVTRTRSEPSRRRGPLPPAGAFLGPVQQAGVEEHLRDRLLVGLRLLGEGRVGHAHQAPAGLLPAQGGDPGPWPSG